jgi:outer membrane protein assembly factor BamB
LWTDDPTDDAWTTPTIVGDRVHVAAGHGGLRILDLETGDPLRALDLPGYTSAPPTPDRRARRLLVGTDEGVVRAYAMEEDVDGWYTECFGQFRVAASPTPYGVYVATTGGEVYCLDPDDGRGRWRTKLPGEITAAPVALKGDVVVPCFDGSVHRLGGQYAGEPAWSADRGGFVRGSLSVAGGTVFGAHGSEVVALDADSGEEEWAADVGGQAGAALAVAGDTLYAGSFGGEVHAFALDGLDRVGPLELGGRKWSASVPGGCGEGAAVADDTLVTMGQGGEDESSKLVAFRDP